MKTLLIGNFGAENLGDELILWAALQTYPNSVVMTSNPTFSQTFTEKDFETISMPPTGLRSMLKAVGCKDVACNVSEINQIIFPGGGLFAITPKAYFIWAKVIDWCVKSFPQASIILEHQGVDEPKNNFEKYLLKKALSKVSKVTVRDENSAKVVEKYSPHKPQIVGDRVETLHATSLNQNPQATSQELLLINAMSDYDKASVQQKFPEHKITEIAFGKGDLGIQPKTKTELFSLFEQADAVVGERFHSLILGNKFCPRQTYLLRPAYSQKVRDLQTRIGLTVL